MQSICGGKQLQQLREIVKALTTDGEIWECGVYRGGSAKLLHEIIGNRTLRLFDTFGKGIPAVSSEDKDGWVRKGQFSLTEKEYQDIQDFFTPLKNVCLHPGIIPSTFVGLEDCKIALAHIDVDVFDAYVGCLDFIYPRLQSSGYLVFDDYGCRPCPGAAKAVDRFIRSFES